MSAEKCPVCDRLRAEGAAVSAHDTTLCYAPRGDGLFAAHAMEWRTRSAAKTSDAVDARSEPLGPTGLFPLGKIADDDKGELNVGFSVTAEGLVRVDFVTPVTWLGLEPDEADGLAAALTEHARKAREKKTR